MLLIPGDIFFRQYSSLASDLVELTRIRPHRYYWLFLASWSKDDLGPGYESTYTREEISTLHQLKKVSLKDLILYSYLPYKSERYFALLERVNREQVH